MKLTYNTYLTRWAERYENERISSKKVPMSVNVWENEKKRLEGLKSVLDTLKVEDTVAYWNNYNKLVAKIDELESKLEGWDE